MYTCILVMSAPYPCLTHLWLLSCPYPDLMSSSFLYNPLSTEPVLLRCACVRPSAGTWPANLNPRLPPPAGSAGSAANSSSAVGRPSLVQAGMLSALRLCRQLLLLPVHERHILTLSRRHGRSPREPPLQIILPHFPTFSEAPLISADKEVT